MHLGVTVGSILQFMATIEILNNTLCGEKCLLIVEGMNPLVLAQKVSSCTLTYVYICMYVYMSMSMCTYITLIYVYFEILNTTLCGEKCLFGILQNQHKK
jgi:hypothetical protein